MSPSVTPKTSVLVVEDDPVLRTVIGDALEAQGFRVIEAEDGVEGMAAYRRERPDVVLADLQMPRLRGIELLRRLRDEDPDVRVVLMTGYATLDLAIAAMKQGAQDFLLKPVRLRRLVEAVNAAVAQEAVAEAAVS